MELEIEQRADEIENARLERFRVQEDLSSLDHDFKDLYESIGQFLDSELGKAFDSIKAAARKSRDEVLQLVNDLEGKLLEKKLRKIVSN